MPPVSCTGSASTVTATFTFAAPVVVSGRLPLTTNNAGTFVSQTQTSPTTVEVVYTSTFAAKTWSIAGGTPHVKTMLGGTNATSSGTFS